MDPAIYKTFFRPLLFRLDAEQAHTLVHEMLWKHPNLLKPIIGDLAYKGKDLECDLFGTKLNNPIGLAAGFDKNGDLVGTLDCLGFGFAEIGSVTALAREGNPKPRLFRLEKDNGLINFMGLNGRGADVVAAELTGRHFSLPIGFNIAKTHDPLIAGDAAIRDIVYTFDKIKNLPFTYVAINVSCPNTKEGMVAEATAMRTVFSELQKINSAKLPVLVKLHQDSTKEFTGEMIEVASSCGLSGFVCGNTTPTRQNLRTDPELIKKIGPGGVSGPPIKSKVLELCRLVYSLKTPSQIIMCTGGITCGQDAFEFIEAGVSFLQIYTGLVYEGPGLPLLINKQLSEILRKKDMTLQQAIGSSQKSKLVEAKS